MFIQFSSWEELLGWIENGLPINIEEHRKNILTHLAIRKEEIKKTWISLFSSINRIEKSDL